VVGAAGFGTPLDERRVYLVASRHGDARDVLLAQVRGRGLGALECWLGDASCRGVGACGKGLDSDAGLETIGDASMMQPATELCTTHAMPCYPSKGRFTCRGDCLQAAGADCWECFRCNWVAALALCCQGAGLSDGLSVPVSFSLSPQNLGFGGSQPQLRTPCPPQKHRHHRRRPEGKVLPTSSAKPLMQDSYAIDVHAVGG